MSWNPNTKSSPRELNPGSFDSRSRLVRKLCLSHVSHRGRLVINVDVRKEFEHATCDLFAVTNNLRLFRTIICFALLCFVALIRACDWSGKRSRAGRKSGKCERSGEWTFQKTLERERSGAERGLNRPLKVRSNLKDNRSLLNISLLWRYLKLTHRRSALYYFKNH